MALKPSQPRLVIELALPEDFPANQLSLRDLRGRDRDLRTDLLARHDAGAQVEPGGLVLHVRTRERRPLSLAALAEILGKPRAEGVYRQLPVVVRRELAVSPLDPGLDAWDLDD